MQSYLLFPTYLPRYLPLLPRLSVSTMPIRRPRQALEKGAAGMGSRAVNLTSDEMKHELACVASGLLLI